MVRLCRTSSLLLLLLAAVCLARPAMAQEAESSVLFRNVRVFDGRGDDLTPSTNVLVVGNAIAEISTEAAPRDGTLVIDGAGRVLMPGLIDAHWHAMMATIPVMAGMTADVGYLNLVAAHQAEATLMRGFTTVRDVGGPVFSLKRAIDEGLTTGPRIYPSGATISQTSGHGDFRMLWELPSSNTAPLSRAESIGGTIIADGADEVLRRTREQLMAGASQIKLMAGGGVSSAYDPLDVTQYTPEELRAAVQAAEDWGTYVTVHVYTPKGIIRAIEAGVKCIEHGHLITDEAAKLMGEKGIWWSLQPFTNDQDVIPQPDPAREAKSKLVREGTDTAYALAKKYNIKVAWGTDTLFSPSLAKRQGAQLAKMVRWYSPAEVLRMATSTNAELLALSGERNPYPGKLGVVEEGALADLLLVEGDPLNNIDLLADPEKNLAVIMKDGRIYKNTLR